MQNTNVSHSIEVVPKSTNPPYFNAIKKDGLIYSVDRLKLIFTLKSPEAMSSIISFLSTNRRSPDGEEMFSVNYTKSGKLFAYRHNFIIKLNNGESFYIAFGFQGDAKRSLEGTIEMNPNKCCGYFVDLECYLYNETYDQYTYHQIYNVDLVKYFLITIIVQNSFSIKVSKFDVAVDVPCKKSQIDVLIDNRTHTKISPSADPNKSTEYLGAKHSSPGCFKIYSKTDESNLDYDLTRLELTSNHENDYKKFISQFPEVYLMEDGPYNAYKELTGTDQVLYEYLINDPNRNVMFKRLGRDKQNKLKPYLYPSKTTFQITIPEDVYEYLMMNMTNLFITKNNYAA